MKNKQSKRSYWKITGKRVSVALYYGVCLMLFLFIMGPLWALNLRGGFESARESVVFYFFPSAQRAYDYGALHFDANTPADYDIHKAQMYFTQASVMDPQLPYVYHQLARIAFLSGEFSKAMSLINIQIQKQGDTVPSSYYVRGLIEGYMGDYSAAVSDYKHFNDLEPGQWAGINDYAWVLLKARNPQEAARITSQAIEIYPTNPWLLNSNATALYETGNIEAAKLSASKAYKYVQSLTPEEWSRAYPGNSPDIAIEGVESFKKAVTDNMHTIGISENK